MGARETTQLRALTALTEELSLIHIIYPYSTSQFSMSTVPGDLVPFYDLHGH